MSVSSEGGFRGRLNALTSENKEMQRMIEQLTAENRRLRQLEIRQTKEIQKFEKSEYSVPGILHHHHKQVEGLKEQIKKYQTQAERHEKRSRQLEEDLVKKSSENEFLKRVGQKCGSTAKEVEALRKKGEEANLKAEENEKEVKVLKKHIDNLEKNHKKEILSLRKKEKESLATLMSLQQKYSDTSKFLELKEKEIEAANIYAIRRNSKTKLSKPTKPTDEEVKSSASSRDDNEGVSSPTELADEEDDKVESRNRREEPEDVDLVSVVGADADSDAGAGAGADADADAVAGAKADEENEAMVGQSTLSPIVEGKEDAFPPDGTPPLSSKADPDPERLRAIGNRLRNYDSRMQKLRAKNQEKMSQLRKKLDKKFGPIGEDKFKVPYNTLQKKSESEEPKPKVDAMAEDDFDPEIDKICKEETEGEEAGKTEGKNKNMEKGKEGEKEIKGKEGEREIKGKEEEDEETGRRQVVDYLLSLDPTRGIVSPNAEINPDDLFFPSNFGRKTKIEATIIEEEDDAADERAAFVSSTAPVLTPRPPKSISATPGGIERSETKTASGNRRSIPVIKAFNEMSPNDNEKESRIIFAENEWPETGNRPPIPVRVKLPDSAPGSRRPPESLRGVIGMKK